MRKSFKVVPGLSAATKADRSLSSASTGAGTGDIVRKARCRRRTRRVVSCTVLLLVVAAVSLFETPWGVDVALYSHPYIGAPLTAVILRAIQVVGIPSAVRFKAHYFEVSVLESGVAQGTVRREDAFVAARRYLALAQNQSNAREENRAAWALGHLYLLSRRYDEAVACLDAALKTHERESWAGDNMSERIRWLMKAGEYGRAVGAFDDFVRYQSNSPWSLHAVTLMWEAYRQLGRKQEGEEHLKELRRQHDGDELGKAIDSVLDGPAASPTRGGTPPPTPTTTWAG